VNFDLLREMLIRHEGLRLRPYKDTRDLWTIGVGWNMKNELPEDIKACLNLTGSITQDMADRLLNISIDMAVRQCRAIFTNFDKFSDNRQAALADWIFNVGAGTAMKFKKMISAIVQGEWERAADELQDSKWFSQVGVRGPELCGMIRNG